MIILKLKFPLEINSVLLIFCGAIPFITLTVIFFKKVFIARDLNLLMIGMYSTALFYLGVRLCAVGIAEGVPDTELLNNSYLLATGEERFASKIFVLLKYFVLIFFPNNLTCDYSYAQIAYRHFSDSGFIVSFILNLTLLIYGIKLVIKRHVIGFAIITYFSFLILVTNFIFDVGAVLREGFLFHASIGAAIAIAWLAITGITKMTTVSFKFQRALMLTVIIIMVFLCACKTWERNWDWKNDVTLFLKDVKTSPNSVLVLGNAGARWIDLADTKEITGKLLPGETPAIFNDYNGTLKITNEELLASGYKTKRELALNRGIGYLKHATELHPRYINGYLNLGLASFKLGNDKNAIFYWKLAERLYPNNPYLQNYYRVYSGILKERGHDAYEKNNFLESAKAYNFCTLVTPNDAEAWYFLGGAVYHLNKHTMAKMCWEKALQIDPKFEKAKKALNGVSGD